MRILILSILIFISSKLLSQDTIYSLAERMPEFKGGEEALYDFLKNNIKRPSHAIELGIEGRVFVTFTVEKDGSLSDIRIIKGIGGGCDEEVLRVVGMMNGMWSPGIHNGKPVRVKYNLPVRFSIEGAHPYYDATINYNRGYNLMKDGKFDKALSFYSTYKPGEILYPDAMYASGYCKFMKGDYKGAIEDWESAKKEGMPDCDNKLAQAYFKLGNQFHQEKKYPIAIACYTKSMELIPDANVLYNRGISYLQLGEKEKACDDWQLVRELGSEDSLSLIEEYCK